jgi:hypothetical protein
VNERAARSTRFGSYWQYALGGFPVHVPLQQSLCTTQNGFVSAVGVLHAHFPAVHVPLEQSAPDEHAAPTVCTHSAISPFCCEKTNPQMSAPQHTSPWQVAPCPMHAHVPPVHVPERHSVGDAHAAPFDARHAPPGPPCTSPLQHVPAGPVAPAAVHAHVPVCSPALRVHVAPAQQLPSTHPAPGGLHAQTPPVQTPLQQFAFSWQTEPTSSHEAHAPFAQTPLQQSVPCWHVPKIAVHAHVPWLHTPLQHPRLAQLCPSSAHGPEPASSLVPPSAWPEPEHAALADWIACPQSEHDAHVNVCEPTE